MCLPDELSQEIDGERENDGRVLFGRNGAQRLQKTTRIDYLSVQLINWSAHLKVSELKGGGRLGNDHGGLLQGGRGLEFSLGRDDFGAGFTGRLSLGCHGALQLDRQTDVLTAQHFNPI